MIISVHRLPCIEITWATWYKKVNVGRLTNRVQNDATLSLSQSASKSLDTGIYRWSSGSVQTSLTGQLCVWKHRLIFGVKGVLVAWDLNTQP